MNLSELRALVGNLADYDPNVSAYNAEIDRLLNSTYLELFALYPWSFAQREAQVWAYPDTSATDGVTTSGSKNVTTTGAFFEDWMEGQVLEIDGDEYEVAQVSSTTSAYLTRAYAGSSATGVSLKAKHRYIDLPADCVSLLQVGVRERVAGDANTGRLVPLTRYEDERDLLSLAQTGTPTHWLPADGVTVRAPYTMPTLSTVVGTWPAGDYEFKVGYRYQNRYSAPSSSTLTYTSTGTTAPVLTLQNTGTGSGYKWVLYLRPPGYTAFRIVADDLAETGGAYSFSGPPDGTWEFKTRAPENGGFTRRLRLWARQDTKTALTVRYLFRPALLVEDQDTPEFEEPFHKAIAEMALTDVCAKKANLPLSEVYRRKAGGTLGNMERRFLTEVPRRWVKGSAWGEWGARYAPAVTLTRVG